MKTRAFFIIMLVMLFSIPLTAQNITVSGVQNGVWDADTVSVTGDVFVTDSLVISSGTKVLFCGEYSIRVRYASLKVLGTAADSVVFKTDASTESWNGITAEYSYIESNYSVFSSSKADSLIMDGGAIRMIESEAYINNCDFRDCWAYRSGGAVYALSSEVEMSQCEISDGGCYNPEVDIYTYGAGVFFAGSEATVDRSYFHDNSCAAGCGGGVCVDSSSLIVSHCVFEDNYATNGGGISCIRSDDRTVSIDNVLIDHNTVMHYGGAMHIAQCYDVHIDNVTMCDNVCIGGGGGAMQFHLASKAYINNSIIWGNGWEGEGFLGGDQIWIWDIYSAPEFRNCVLQGGVESIHHGENVTVYENMLEEDPLFSYGYNLSEQSPCHNAGDSDIAPSGILTDLDGNDRFSGSSIDMGAFEFQESQSVASLDEKGLSISPVFESNRLSHIKVTSDTPCHLTILIQDVLGRILWQREASIDNQSLIEIDEVFNPQVLLITASGNRKSATIKVGI